MTVFEAIVIAIVEGITEFLPVSSTAHMIIASSVLGLEVDAFVKNFAVVIQFGAIISVVVLYWRRFFQSVDFYKKLFVAFLPAAVLGFLFDNEIDAMMENVVVIAFTLLLGGIVLLFVDKWFKHGSETEPQEISYSTALKIGFFQAISMIPGVSRSAATIIGGLTQKLNRKTAAEFSFFLAVPTMFGATCLKLMKSYKTIDREHLDLLLLGNIVAFIVAAIAIKSFISFLTKHGFRVFGYYRIAIGLLILILYAFGIPLSLV